MRFEQLEYLLDIKETGSITQTAEKYFISHQAVSKSVKDLEKELSVTLLNRTSKGVVLTAAGKRVADFAAVMFHEKKDMLRDLSTFRSDAEESIISGTVIIYAIPRYITRYMFDFINDFSTRYPQVDIVLHNVTAETIFYDINLDENMLGLVTTCQDITSELNSSFQERNLCYELLDRQLLYACVHKDSDLVKKHTVSIEELQDFQSVSFTYTSFLPIEEYYTAQYTIDSFEQQKALIRMGKCFGRYTEQEFNYFFGKNYAKIPLAENTEMRFMAICSQQRSPLVELFLQEYRKRF